MHLIRRSYIRNNKVDEDKDLRRCQWMNDVAAHPFNEKKMQITNVKVSVSEISILTIIVTR